MKTYLKTLERMFQKHIMRFLSVIFIVVISVGLVSGMGSSVEYIKSSLTNYYSAQNISDFIAKCTADGGFTDEEMDKLYARYGKDNVQTGMSLDVDMTVSGENAVARLYFLDFSDWRINIPRYVSGKSYADDVFSDGNNILCAEESKGLKSLPKDSEVVLDFGDIISQSASQADKQIDSAVSERLSQLEKVKAKVGGIVISSIAFTYDGEPSYIQEDGAVAPDAVNALESLNTIDYIFFIPIKLIPSYFDILTESERGMADAFPAVKERIENELGHKLDERLIPERGDAYIAAPDRTLFNSFSKKYNNYVKDEKVWLESSVQGEIITLDDNYSFASLNAYSDKVLAIAVVLMVAFTLVTALVVSTNMSRLMDEERSQIACLRTLGYSGFKIIMKYMAFALIATAIAGVAAYFVGLGLAAFIYYVFNYSYIMPPMAMHVAVLFYLLVYFVVAGAIVATTVITGIKLVNEKPAALLLPRAPKAGKTVILERIPLLWNRLSFKYKSTVRNVLRYKNRFFMTVIAVACSTGLVLAALALIDLCLFKDFGSEAILGLALIILMFAGLLTMAVIYALTNINVSERNREIATLMVLGYQDGEVAGYIYREVYINTLIGIVFGYPVGVLIVWLMFKVMNFGVLGAVSWFVWAIAPFVVLIFTALVTLILRRKIVTIDMNESLKANE